MSLLSPVPAAYLRLASIIFVFCDDMCRVLRPIAKRSPPLRSTHRDDDWMLLPHVAAAEPARASRALRERKKKILIASLEFLFLPFAVRPLRSHGQQRSSS